jgi:hypothetical protein
MIFDVVSIFNISFYTDLGGGVESGSDLYGKYGIKKQKNGITPQKRGITTQKRGITTHNY